MVAVSGGQGLLRRIPNPFAGEGKGKVGAPPLGNGERMVAVRDFSGFVSSLWAFASAAAMAPMASLERCIGDLHHLKADGAGFRALCLKAMSDCLLGIFRHQFLQVRLGGLMFLMR